MYAYHSSEAQRILASRINLKTVVGYEAGYLDMDRGRDGLNRHSLRTGLAGLPHPALQLVVHLLQD